MTLIASSAISRRLSTDKWYTSSALRPGGRVEPNNCSLVIGIVWLVPVDGGGKIG